MGKHHNSLVKIVKDNNLWNHESKSIRSYLALILADSYLYEFPFIAQDIFSKSGLTHPVYNQMLDNFVKDSHKDGKFLPGPVEVLGIEDKDSLVILDYLTPRMSNEPINQSTVISAMNLGTEENIDMILMMGQIKWLGYKLDKLPTGVNVLYSSKIKNGMSNPLDVTSIKVATLCAQDLFAGAISYIEQTKYLMDPKNNAELRAIKKYK